MTPNRRAAAVVLTLGLVVGASACGGDPEVCSDVDALRADVDDLRAIDLQPGALADFSAALDDVRADVDQLVESAESEYEAEIDAVRSTTQALTASVETAVQDPSGPTVTQVSSDFGAFTTAVGDLRDAVGDTC
jgi:hypothetical protein